MNNTDTQQKLHQLEQEREALVQTCHEQHESLQRRDAILDAISSITVQFLTTDDLDASIQTMLEHLGKSTDVSRVYIFQNHHADDGTLLMSQKYEWCAPNIEPQIDNPELQDVAYYEMGFDRWADIMKQGKPIYGNVSTFPEGEREMLEAQDILFIVVMPIFSGSDWWGFIGFDECAVERSWSTLDLKALNAAATIMGSAIQRRLAEEERENLQQQIIEAQQSAIRELSTPLIPLSSHVVLMPLIGSIDSSRAQMVMETLLEGIAIYQADTAILDITGVSVVDTQVANALVQAAQAVKLLGAKVVLTGIGPTMAQTLVHLGADLSNLHTRGNLQSAVVEALTMR